MDGETVAGNAMPAEEQVSHDMIEDYADIGGHDACVDEPKIAEDLQPESICMAKEAVTTDLGMDCVLENGGSLQPSCRSPVARNDREENNDLVVATMDTSMNASSNELPLDSALQTSAGNVSVIQTTAPTSSGQLACEVEVNSDALTTALRQEKQSEPLILDNTGYEHERDNGLSMQGPNTSTDLTRNNTIHEREFIQGVQVDAPFSALAHDNQVSLDDAAVDSATQLYPESKDGLCPRDLPEQPSSQTIQYRQDDVWVDSATQNYAEIEMSLARQEGELDLTEFMATQNYEDSTMRPLPSPCRNSQVDMPPPLPKNASTRHKGTATLAVDSASKLCANGDTPALHSLDYSCIAAESLATQDYAETPSCLPQNSSTLPADPGALREYADSEEMATQQYVESGTSIPESLHPPTADLQKLEAGLADECATQRYGESTDKVQWDMPPPPVPCRKDRDRKKDSLDLAEDCATQCYSEDINIARMAMSSSEECATQCYERDTDMASMAIRPAVLPNRSAEVSWEDSATQRYEDPGSIPAQSGGPTLEDEVPATQAYVEIGNAAIGREQAPRARTQDDTCSTQCYSEFTFSGSICIVPDGADSSEEEGKDGGKRRGSRALGAAPKWSARPQSISTGGVRKRPAAAPDIRSVLLGSSGMKSSSASASTSRKRPFDVCSPTAARTQDLVSTPKRRLCGKQKLPAAYAAVSKPTPVKEVGSKPRGGHADASCKSKTCVASRHVRRSQERSKQIRPKARDNRSQATVAKEEDSDDEVMWMGQAQPGAFAQM